MTSEVRRDVVLYSRQCGIGAVGAVHAAGQDVDGREVLLVADADVLEALRVLLVGQELPRAVLRGPLERHAVLAFARPLALQIGVAPRRALAPRRFTVRLRVSRARRPTDIERRRNRERAGRESPRGQGCHVIDLLPIILGLDADVQPCGGTILPEF